VKSILAAAMLVALLALPAQAQLRYRTIWSPYRSGYGYWFTWPNKRPLTAYPYVSMPAGWVACPFCGGTGMNLGLRQKGQHNVCNWCRGQGWLLGDTAPAPFPILQPFGR